MGKLLVEYNRPSDSISTVVEAALLPNIKVALDSLAHGLEETYAPWSAPAGEAITDDNVKPDLKVGFRAVRQQLVCELILWLENEFHDGEVEVIITGYDPDAYLERGKQE